MSIRYLIAVAVFFSFTSINRINEKDVKRIISTLSSNQMEGRAIGSEGIKKAANFIANEFKAIGLSNFGNEETYLQEFSKNSKSNRNPRANKKKLANIVGVIKGKRPNEIVLFSAHYDHLGVKKRAVNGDSIYNGANDDASGVTAVIELARYFKSKGKPERTLVFVAFTGEETGGYGSKYFSRQLNPDEIIAMFNIEMIGKVSSKGSNSAWMTGWDKSNLGSILQENLAKVDFNFFEDPYPQQNLFYRSDNATLARLGVPAHSISTTQIDIDKDYHHLSDEIETLDITNITNTIQAIAVGAQGIVDGKQTPTRVDPNKVR